MNDSAMVLPFHPVSGDLYDEIAKSHPSLLRDRVWCTRCSSFRDVNTAECLRSGWPKCPCGGGTMSIDRQRSSPP